MFNLANRTHPLKIREFWFVGCHIGVIAGLGWYVAAEPSQLASILLIFVSAILAVSFHEAGHAYFAFLGGDWTVRGAGYLTLDFRRYVHPILTLLFPLLFFVIGGIPLPGGAVHIRSEYIKSFIMRILMCLGGVIGNMVFVGILILIKKVLVPYPVSSELLSCLDFLLYLNVCMIVFNLLPVPPLDGFNVLTNFFPQEAAQNLRRVAGQFGFLAVAYLIFFDNPVIGAVWEFVRTVSVDLGCDMGNVRKGYELAKVQNLSGITIPEAKEFLNRLLVQFNSFIN